MADIPFVALQVAVATLIACVAWGTFKVYKVIYRGAVLKRQFPNMTSDSIFLGVLNKLSTPDRHKVLAHAVKELGPNLYLRVAWFNVLVITEPAIVSEVLHRQDLDKVDEVYASIQPMMSESGHNNLLTSPTDESWRLVRKGVAPAFSPHNIRKGFHHAAACGDHLVKVLHAKGASQSVNIGHACLSETIDMIGLFGFGHSFNAIKMFDKDQHAQMMKVMITAEKEVQRRLQDPTRVFIAPFTQDGWDAAKSFREYQAITRELLAEMRARGEPEEDDGSIGALLLRIRDAAGQPLSDEVLLPQIGLFFFAGFDTTGHTITWTLYLLSQNSEAEARVVVELRDLGLLASPQQPQPRALEYTDLAKLTCLNDVLRESMRLKAVAASGTVRMAHHDITLGGGKYQIPGGTALCVPIHSVHTSEENWGSDADSFKPERWLDPGAQYQTVGSGVQQQGGDKGPRPQKEPSASENFELGISRSQVGRPDAEHIKRFIPFGDGKRDCVGQSMARMNAMSTLARLLSHFHFKLAPEMGGAASVEAQEVVAITMQPGGDGILMNCIPRAGTMA